MAWRIGVDAGGTFTDVCLFDDGTGRLEVWKLASTPDDPLRGIAQGIEDAIDRAEADQPDAMPRLPVRSVAAEPSAGMAGAREIARLAGFADLIGFDMGGSRAAVARLDAAACQLVDEVPGADIHTVGAGGGSIAWLGSDGALAVGPRSAGADPGPACTGHGGAEPTLNDAHVVLQTLNPERLLGGRLRLRQDLARAAIGVLAATLGLDELATAQRIVSVVTAGMAAAIRATPVLPGGTLVAFGGAGPLHAARLARELGIPRILVPLHAGVLGALGLLLTDPRAEFSATAAMALRADSLPAIAEAFGLLRHRAAVWFAEHKIPARTRRIARSVDLPQADGTALSVPLADGPVTAATLEALAGAVAAAHPPLHAAAGDEAPRLVTFRVAAVGRLPRPGFPPHPDAGPDAAACTGRRDVWLPEAGGWASCAVYDRARLESGNRIAGPAVVEQMDATTLILPGMTARVDPYLNLVLQAGG